ncbi:LPS export ABC transporter permease LptG [bacterium]|nr:LPS export ABC transporter permease LptG [bacterium]
MKLLDKYILRNFLAFIGWAILAFLILYYVVDIVENVDKFIDKEAELIDVILYYLSYTPYIIVLVSPIALLLAGNFTSGNFSRHREIVATRSGGISSLRVGAPIVLFGLIWAFFIIFFSEFVVPKTNAIREEIKTEKIDKKRTRTTRVRDLLYQGDDGNVYSIGSLDPKRSRAMDILIVSFDSHDKIDKMTRAREARYEHGQWILYDGHIYGFSDNNTHLYSSFSEKKLRFRESPIELAERRVNPDEMGFFELRRFILRVQRAGGDPLKERTDLLMKITYPFINFIILLFGVPLSLRFRRSGLMVGFAQSVAIGFLYFGVIRTGQVLGYNGTLPPILAATLGNIIFGIAGIYLLFSLRE